MDVVVCHVNYNFLDSLFVFNVRNELFTTNATSFSSSQKQAKKLKQKGLCYGCKNYSYKSNWIFSVDVKFSCLHAFCERNLKTYIFLYDSTLKAAKVHLTFSVETRKFVK